MAKLLNLEVASSTVQTVSANAAANMGNIVRILSCTQCNIPTFNYINGNTIILNSSGYYNIDVSSTFTGAVGNGQLTLYANGVAIPYASATESLTTANTEYRSISFSTKVRVLPNNPVTITLVNTGTIALSLASVDVNITKVV